MAQASLLACEGLSGVCLVPTVASKKMMPKQSSKQGHRKESEKSRSRKEEETAGGSPPKKSLKKVMVIEQNGSFQVRIPKNFICEHCFGAFRSSYHLKRHILIHTGIMPEKTNKQSLYLILQVTTAARIIFAQYWKNEGIPSDEEIIKKILECTEMDRLTMRLKEKRRNRILSNLGHFIDG